MSYDKYFVFSEEVKDGLEKNKALVALESTLIAHGMPYPENLRTAQELEQLIRDEGAVPATIALLNGKICIGLTGDQLIELATNPHILKASKRDISYVLSQKKSAATTVAATMYCAHMAGIHFFATGGIGGVHRGVHQTWDVSADLYEFLLSPVTVVSAGAKSILDLPKTLEYLESLGVPVVGYRTWEFPSFYSRKSGLTLSMRLDDPRSLAEMVFTQWDVGFQGGILLANPIPEAYELDSEMMETHIHRSLEKAYDLGIKGKDLTPFLLGSIKEETQGKSLLSNIELVKNNALVAAQVAKAYQELAKEMGYV